MLAIIGATDSATAHAAAHNRVFDARIANLSGNEIENKVLMISPNTVFSM